MSDLTRPPAIERPSALARPNPFARPAAVRRLREKLLRRIHLQYETVTEPAQIGRFQFDFTRIKNPDTVLDQVAAAVDLHERLHGRNSLTNDTMHLPYWAELWDSAGGIGRFLCERRDWVRDKCVLDLGCGMGLSGTIAAMLGGRVLFADLEAPALLFARLNSLPAHRRVRTRRVNWQIDQLHETFDLITGADIVYERSQWNYLDNFWKTHLCATGSILLGEPGRQTGDDFPGWIVTRGWTIERFEQPVPTRPKPIRILRLQRAF